MVATGVRLQPAEGEMMLTGIVVGVAFGLGMFLLGTLVEVQANRRRVTDAWLDGFRDGWEASVQFDNDVRIVWGGDL